jgi:glycerophosphoryl diester phosphodiesterase/HEAT repeat protein
MRATTKQIVASLLIAIAASIAYAENTTQKRVELLCHRTANEDVPENTLESLKQAALLGCDVVEIDLRRTLDGKLVLNHDGVLERLTDGIGDTEESYYDDLRLRDAGVWMADRFKGMQIPLFEDALRLAREQNIRLILDIKDKGIGADVLQLLEREGMLQRVRFGGEWSDVKQIYPRANPDVEVWVQPGVAADQVRAYHQEGKTVIANFSANDHEMDLAGMKAAVAAGVDGINVDYPRLGADAVGRPVEKRLSALALQADAGESSKRARAILDLAQYRGFRLQPEFAHWLLDPDDHVSRAAAVALVLARPRTPYSVLAVALRSNNADARANAAWALGRLGAPASMLSPLLHDTNQRVLKQALAALATMPGDVDARMLLSLLSYPDPVVRGTAAIALAQHQPDTAVKAIPAQLRSEVGSVGALYASWVSRGKTQLTADEIARIMSYYRCQMKMLQAISMLDGAPAMRALEEQAFRPGEDFAQMNGVVAAFQLWDRIGIGDDSRPVVTALAAQDVHVADKAEWMLVQASPAVLPEVRKALLSQNVEVRKRAIRIVAWQGDLEAVQRLRQMRETDSGDAELLGWAIEKIQLLHPKLSSRESSLGVIHENGAKTEEKGYAASRNDYVCFQCNRVTIRRRPDAHPGY